MKIRMAAVFVLLCAAGAGAQISETITVSESSVDVIVRDGRGNPVTGLTQADFEVFEKGVKRDITHFEEITSTQVAPTARRIMIVIDSNSLPPGERKQTVESLKKWIPLNVRPGDQMMVVSLQPAASVKVPWTTDQKAVLESFKAVSKDRAGILAAERRRAEVQIQNLLRDARQSSSELSTGAFQQSPPTITFEELTMVAEGYAVAAQRHATATITAIGALLNGFTSSAAEKKMMLLVGSGLPVHPGMDVFADLDQVKLEAAMGTYPLLENATTASPISDGMRYNVKNDIEALARIAKRKGVVVYGLNPVRVMRGASMERDLSNSNADVRRDMAGNSGYELLASATSGLAFPGAHPQGALDDMTKDLRSYYEIAYKSTGSPEKVQVKTKGGHRVRVALSAGGFSREQLVQESVVAHLLAEPTTNDLGITLQNEPPVIEKGRKKVRLRVFIPVDKLRLLTDAGQVKGSFNVYVASGNERGAASAVNRQTHEIQWSEADLAKRKTIGFSVNVFLHRDADEISVGVLDETSSLTGFQRTKVSG